jgi:hypothetical protein
MEKANGSVCRDAMPNSEAAMYAGDFAGWPSVAGR